MLFPTDDSRHPLAEDLRTFIRNPPFPCVGAKSALSRDGIRIVVARDITSAWDDMRIYPALLAFICRYRERPELFQSFAVLFEGPTDLSEAAFEDQLWARVQSLSDKDSCLGQPYDPRVASDPDNPHFSLSLGGEAFFVVGLHPRSSRRARRFAVPALIFNLHDQFENLRAQGRFERMRQSIMARDEAWTGSRNPMLADHGERSPARQFSGRAVSDDWACPFQRRARPEPHPDDAAQVARDLRSGAFLDAPLGRTGPE